MTLKNALIEGMVAFPKVYLELSIREGGYLLPMVSDWCANTILVGTQAMEAKYR
jgi:hypothetical protein